MDRAVTVGVAVAVVVAAVGCGSGTRPDKAATAAASEVRMRPGSCHEAQFEPVAGNQVVPIAATSRTPAALGVRMAPSAAGRSFDYVRIDVLPAGAHADAPPGEPQLLDGDEKHVRRYVASASQLAEGTVSFDFDGRDGSGTPLGPGSYEVGFVVRTRSHDAGCTDPVAVKYGHLTTVVWTP